MPPKNEKPAAVEPKKSPAPAMPAPAPKKAEPPRASQFVVFLPVQSILALPRRLRVGPNVIGKDEADLARMILARPGILRFRAQDAVDAGVLSAEEVAALGYGVIKRADAASPADVPLDATPAPAAKDARGLPLSEAQLARMPRKELLEFAEAEGLLDKVSLRSTHERLVRDVMKAYFEKVGGAS